MHLLRTFELFLQISNYGIWDLFPKHMYIRTLPWDSFKNKGKVDQNMQTYNLWLTCTKCVWTHMACHLEKKIFQELTNEILDFFEHQQP
jgi:hypothetical protein